MSKRKRSADDAQRNPARRFVRATSRGYASLHPDYDRFEQAAVSAESSADKVGGLRPRLTCPTLRALC